MWRNWFVIPKNKSIMRIYLYIHMLVEHVHINTSPPSMIILLLLFNSLSPSLSNCKNILLIAINEWMLRLTQNVVRLYFIWLWKQEWIKLKGNLLERNLGNKSHHKASQRSTLKLLLQIFSLISFLPPAIQFCESYSEPRKRLLHHSYNGNV